MWSVATPSRALSFLADARRRSPRPLGGDNGTVSLPSREAATRGQGTPAGPGPRTPIDGALGTVFSPRPVLDWTTFPQRFRLATPIGRLSPIESVATVRYIRRNQDNMVPVADFAPPVIATTNRTTNTTEECAPMMPASPIPRSRMRVTQTFRDAFDTRCQADYLARESIQVGVAMRRYLYRDGPVMVAPYYPRLTRLAPTTSYGQTTQVLTNPYPQGYGSPYSTGDGALSRFTV